MDCIFCKIAQNKLQSVKIYEDKEHLAILDAHPNTEGQALVITKKHYTSYPFDIPDNVYSKILLVAKKLGKILDKTFSSRTCLVIEGFQIDHIHIKLYPVKKDEPLKTFVGHPVNKEELEKIANKIKKNFK